MGDKTLSPCHYSGIRHLVFEKMGRDYLPLETYDECKSYEDAYVILEGDDGGIIYLTAPFKKIKCSEKELNKLLDELDGIAWDDRNREGRRVYYERYDFTGNVNDLILIPGGCGGGFITPDRVWVHEKFKKPEYLKKIKQTILQEKTERAPGGI